MANRRLKMNPGAQEDFVAGDEKYSAYIGGLGSGKTWAGIARGLKYSLQPIKGHHPPFGIIATATFPAINDTIIPKLQEMMAITGLADWGKDYARAKKELTLINGSVIRLRSLDNPDVVGRGPEYTWFYIDEGRNVGLKSWQNLTARLRQPGYDRMGCVGSTPNGFDWMYDVFHPDGALHVEKYPNSKWYNAATDENTHLDDDYLISLKGGMSGRFLQQEFYGQFVGIVEGGVFDQWDVVTGLKDEIPFDPDQPLYSFWDFGVGDPGVCIFAQVKWETVTVPFTDRTGKLTTANKKFPFLYILHSQEAADWTAKEWADHYHHTIETRFQGRKTRGDYGDPAGTQRNPSTGTSVITDLNSAGVPIVPVRKRPQDYAIRILNNMMAGGRVFVNREGAKRVSDAFSSHKWHLKDGVRIGINPVHDWTSHYVDACRYGASVLLSFNPRDEDLEARMTYQPNQWGWVFDEMDRADEDEGFFTGGPRKPNFIAPTIRAR